MKLMPAVLHGGRTLLIAVPAAVVLSFSGADACTFHVATGGDDANPGTTESPWRTMRERLAALALGIGVGESRSNGSYEDELKEHAGDMNDEPCHTFQI